MWAYAVVGGHFLHTMKVKRVPSSFGLHWLSLYEQNSLNIPQNVVKTDPLKTDSTESLSSTSCMIWDIILSWQLSEDYSMVMDMTVNVFGLGGIDLLCCWIAAAVGYCCCCRLLLLLQSKYRNLLLPMHTPIRGCEYLRHTAAAQIAYKITRSRSIQVEQGKVECFRGTLKAHCKML